MRQYPLKGGGAIPCLGMGTWYLGEGRRSAREEEAALLSGIDAGLKLIDTAEMYGGGRSEELIGRVLKHRRREEVFLVSKAYPHHAGLRSLPQACEDSLRRLGTDHLDLYLLHWRGGVPLQETAAAMDALVRQGKVLHWGVSNFDVEDMEELFLRGGGHCAVNQVLYHLGSRGIEVALQPWHRAHGVVTMAYCPLAQGGRLRQGLLEHPAVRSAAEQLHLTELQVLLGFVLSQDNTVAIPRTGSAQHMALNAAMGERSLPQEIIDRLSRAFPPPRHRVPLDME